MEDALSMSPRIPLSMPRKDRDLLLTLLCYHEKITLAVPWGQYDPITKNTFCHE